MMVIRWESIWLDCEPWKNHGKMRGMKILLWALCYRKRYKMFHWNKYKTYPYIYLPWITMNSLYYHLFQKAKSQNQMPKVGSRCFQNWATRKELLLKMQLQVSSGWLSAFWQQKHFLEAQPITKQSHYHHHVLSSVDSDVKFKENN